MKTHKTGQTYVEGAMAYFQNKMKYTTGPVEVAHFLDQKDDTQHFQLVDVRAREDYEKGHIHGAISLPEDEWPKFTGLLNDRVNILYCYTAVCHLAAQAAVFFAASGYPVMEMEGGFQAWKDNNLPVEEPEEVI